MRVRQSLIALPPRLTINHPRQHEPSDGGGGGIRTRETIHHRLHTFQACAFNRSATPPCRTESWRGNARLARPAKTRNETRMSEHP